MFTMFTTDIMFCTIYYVVCQLDDNIKIKHLQFCTVGVLMSVNTIFSFWKSYITKRRGLNKRNSKHPDASYSLFWALVKKLRLQQGPWLEVPVFREGIPNCHTDQSKSHLKMKIRKSKYINYIPPFFSVLSPPYVLNLPTIVDIIASEGHLRIICICWGHPAIHVLKQPHMVSLILEFFLAFSTCVSFNPAHLSASFNS